MSEQYPLLCDDLSEEERFSPQYRRQLMSRTRARNQVNGAAAILKRWPGEWTSILHYWWIGIGMIAITTYLLYNCLFSYAMLQTSNNSYHKPNNINRFRLNPPIKPLLPPKVFMHIFADEKQEIDLNNYLPYIDIITKKYKHFKYHLIIVANDTDSKTKELSDQDNNRLALNSLWYNSDNNKIKSSYSNLHIKYTTLSKCFYESPLDKFWRNLPDQFLKFLVRAISVWEKGGIAFDPIVLTPQSPNSIYIEKIYRILKKYNFKKGIMPSKKFKNTKNNNKPKSIPNNILDVIHALENENATEKVLQDPLQGVETKDIETVAHVRKRSPIDIDGNKKNITKEFKLKKTQNVQISDMNLEKRLDSSPKLNLLPMFLNYLFHNKETNHADELKSNELIKHADADHLPKDIVSNTENKTYHMRELWNEITYHNNYKPVIVSAKGIVDRSPNGSNIENSSEKDDASYEVTIDLKGNIIATDTICHAFIGGMFSNAIHHEHSETVTEFIIKELSIFCKGLFSSCVGIDVILF